MGAVIQEELVSIERAIPMRHVWAMPSANTFDIPPIRALVKSYLYRSKVSVDPFARNKRWATHTNDLNPETAADSHLQASDFLSELAHGIADLVVFDPPYSPHQTKECYAGFGHSMRYEDDARHGWSKTRKLLSLVLQKGGVAISCGWDSIGVLGRNGRIEQILIVCHGIGHNDTIVTVERKVESQQSDLFATGPSVDFSCRVCGVQCATAPDPPSRAICPAHCEDHDYEYVADRRGRYCKHCDEEEPRT